MKTKVDTKNDTFKENYHYHSGLSEAMCNQKARIALGGPEKVREKHTARGKLLVRDRIKQLLDSDSFFMEIGAFAALGAYPEDVPAAGLVAGIGKIQDQLCMIIANDATVKGGTYYPLTVKKHLRAQQIAEENLLPCVYLVDSGGANLPYQDEVFPDKEHFGRIFYNQARMSAKGIYQLSIVMGSCTAGGAYIPAMSDEVIMVENNATIFLAGPPLVKAATGEVVSAEELGGADVHTRISGVADHMAPDEPSAIAMAREAIGYLPKRNIKWPDLSNKPKYDADELLGILPMTLRNGLPAHEVIARLVDNSEFHEFKARFGTSVVTGFAKIGGFDVGIIANNGILFSESSLKATHFINLCTNRGVPLLYLQNVTGYMVGKKFEHGGIAKDGAKMVMATSCANVPKLTVIIGGSFGAGNYGMCGRAFDPRFLWTWPNAHISVMGGEQAANVLVDVKKAQLDKSGESMTAESEKELRANIIEDYEKRGNAYAASSRLWDDGIIDPRDTRVILAQCLCAVQFASGKTDFGVFRQ